MSEESNQERKRQEHQAEQPSPQQVFNANFQLDMNSFLQHPVLYSNIPNVTFDGHSWQFAFLTWTMPPGGEGPGKDNPINVVARIAMPQEAMLLMLQQIQQMGVKLSEAEGRENGE